MQKDLDVYPKAHDHERSHQGRDIKGRTPYQVFVEELPKSGKETKPEIKKAAQRITAPRRAVSGEYYLCTP